MLSRGIHFGLIAIAIALVVTGCAPTPSAPPAATVSMPTVMPLSPTATSAPTATAVPKATADSSAQVIQFVLVPEKSEARYRVTEQLANLNLPNDAVGRTREFTGTLVIRPDGTLVAADSKFVVNLGTLQSDRSQRDNFLRGNVLQTSQHPTAVFVPTQAIGLPSPLPQSGPVSFKLTGDLTIRNITKPVTWNVTATIQGNEVIGQATTSFKFGDFNLTQPRVPVVLSIEDNIRLELDVTLRRR